MKIKPRFYFIISAFIIGIMTAVFYINLQTDQKELNWVETKSTTLKFEEVEQISKWNGQDVKTVYLTFDDGPSKNVTKVLDILKQYDVDGTFFVLGTALQNNRDSEAILKRMIDEGHYIGFHSMTHDYSTLYKGANAADNFVSEMKELQSIVSDMTGGFVGNLCRAPYGTGGGTFTKDHVKALKAAGIKCWDWDVDSLDWSTNKSGIMENVKLYTEINKNKDNLVVLFHEKDSTVEALPSVIKYYQDLGYEFAAYDPENHFVRNLIHSEDL